MINIFKYFNTPRVRISILLTISVLAMLFCCLNLSIVYVGLIELFAFCSCIVFFRQVDISQYEVIQYKPHWFWRMCILFCSLWFCFNVLPFIHWLGNNYPTLKNAIFVYPSIFKPLTDFAISHYGKIMAGRILSMIILSPIVILTVPIIYYCFRWLFKQIAEFLQVLKALILEVFIINSKSDIDQSKIKEPQSFFNELKNKIENRYPKGKTVCSPIFWIEVIFFITVLSGFPNYYTNTDTSSYSWFPVNVFRGETHKFRTPVYPYVIKTVTFFTREKLHYNEDAQRFSSGVFSIHCLIALQTIVMGISLCLLYYSAKHIIKSPVVLFITILFVGLGLSSYQRWILTEPLSISFIMIFISLMINYLSNPTSLKAAGISLFSLILVMLRPVFIYVVALLWAFWLMRIVFSNSRITSITGTICLMLTSVCIFEYYKLNERNNGFWGISQIGTINQLNCIMFRGFYKDGSDPEINQYIENLNLDPSAAFDWNLTMRMIEKFSYNRIDQYSKVTIRNNFIPYSICCLKSMWRDSYKCYWKLFYLLGITDFILCIVLWIRFSQIPWLRLGMWGLFYGLIAIIYFNVTYDYERLCSPCLPALYIIIARYIDMLVIASSKPREEFIEYIKSTL